jgi:hypothetical protein
MSGGVYNYFSLKVKTLKAPMNAELMRSLPVGSKLFSRNTDAYCLNGSICMCVPRVFVYVLMHVPMLR